MLANVKSKIQQQRSAQRMAQDQVRFEMDEKRQEREHHAELRRMGLEHMVDLGLDARREMNKPEKLTETQTVET